MGNFGNRKYPIYLKLLFKMWNNYSLSVALPLVFVLTVCVIVGTLAICVCRKWLTFLRKSVGVGGRLKVFPFEVVPFQQAVQTAPW